jgi:hypothetical protein
MTDIKKIDELVENIFQQKSSLTIPGKIEIPKKPYDVKLVAWFDVLGMSNEILTSSNADDILSQMGKLKNYVENSCEVLFKERKLNFIQLNDGFIIVAELDCINELCEILCQIQWKVLIDSKKLLRGALTAGMVTMSEDSKLILGPAFIKALRMETTNAIFPRILFANEIVDYIDKNNITQKYINKDADHFQYLNYLQWAIDKYKYSNKLFDNVLTKYGIKALITSSYQEFLTKDKKIAQKYGWLISKLKDHDINLKEGL